MFSRTRANNRSTRSGSSTKKKGSDSNTAASLKRKSLQGSNKPVSPKARRVRSLSPGASTQDEGKSPRQRGRPPGKKVTAPSHSPETSTKPEVTLTRGAAKSLPRKQSPVQSPQESKQNVSRKGNQGLKVSALVTPKRRQPEKQAVGVTNDEEGSVTSKRGGAKKEVIATEGKSVGRRSSQGKPKQNTVAESPRKNVPLIKKSIRKGKLVAEEEILKGATGKTEMLVLDEEAGDSEPVMDRPVARGRGRPPKASGKKRIVSSKVGSKKSQLVRAKKLTAQARQVKQDALKKIPQQGDESQDSATDEEVDELLAEPSVFSKLSHDVPSPTSTKVEVGSVEELKSSKPLVESVTDGVRRGRVEKRQITKKTTVTRKKVRSRELAALNEDPGSKLGDKKLNTGGRLRSISSGRISSQTIVKRVKRRPVARCATARGMSPGSDTTSQLSTTSRGQSPSSDTDVEGKKHGRRRLSPAERLRCPFLATRKRRTIATGDFYNVRGPGGKFTTKPGGQESEASDSATEQSSSEKRSKLSVTAFVAQRGRARRRRERAMSTTGNSAAADIPLSEADQERRPQSLPDEFKSKEIESVNVLPSVRRTVSNVARSVKSNPSTVSTRKRLEQEKKASNLSPAAQSIVKKSFSLKAIEKFRKAFKLVDPVGKSSSKDSVSSADSGGGETTEKETVSSVKEKEIPVGEKSKEEKDSVINVTIDVENRKALLEEDKDTTQAVVESNITEKKKTDIPIPEIKEPSADVPNSLESAEDSDVSFKLEISVDSSSSEDLRANSDKILKEPLVTDSTVHKKEVSVVKVDGKTLGGLVTEIERVEEPMETSKNFETKPIDSSSKDVIAESVGEAKTHKESKAESQIVDEDTTSVISESKTTDTVSDPLNAESKTAADELSNDEKLSKNDVDETKKVISDLSADHVELETVVSKTKPTILGTGQIWTTAETVKTETKTDEKISTSEDKDDTMTGIIVEKPSDEATDKIDDSSAKDLVCVRKEFPSNKANIEVSGEEDENISAPISGPETELSETVPVESDEADIIKPGTQEKAARKNIDIVEDAIAKAVRETVQSIVHGVEEEIESGEQELTKDGQDKELEMQGASADIANEDDKNVESSGTGNAEKAVDEENSLRTKGPIILKIKTSTFWNVDGDGSSGTSTGSAETEEVLDNVPAGDGVVVSSSQEVLEASAMSRKVKDALKEVNDTLAIVANREILRADAGENVIETGPSPKGRANLVAKEEETVTSTAEELSDKKGGGDDTTGDECRTVHSSKGDDDDDECPAAESSKEDAVSCSCHPSGKQDEDLALPQAAPVEPAAAAAGAAAEVENVVVEEGQAPDQPAALAPILATASMSDVERRIEEIQAMVSDIQKQIKTGSGTGKAIERRTGIHPLDEEFPYGHRSMLSHEDKGDLKMTIKLGGKKGDAKSEIKGGETSGSDRKGGKKDVDEPKSYPKRHVSPKYNDMPWVEYSDSYFEDLARKQKKSQAKLESKQELQSGDARPKRKPVKKTEYELYMYELKNPKRRKHKSGPTSHTQGPPSESLIDHAEGKSQSNIPELMKLCKPCCVVLEDFVVSLNLSALKRKQGAIDEDIQLGKRPKLNIGDGVYSEAQIDTQAIVKQLTPEKRRRSAGSRSGRRASGSSSAGSLASELESGRLSPSSPRALDVPSSRLSPKPHKRKVNRTGFPKQPRKYYYVYQCKFCPYSTNYRIAMDDHVYTHLDVVPFRCGYCNSVFGAKSGAVAHHKRNHQNLALRCIKSVDVDETQYYNYVYVTGQRKSPVSPRSLSPSQGGNKETRNVFDSIMKEIPSGEPGAVPTVSPVPVVAQIPSAPLGLTTSPPGVPSKPFVHTAPLESQSKQLPIQVKAGPSQAIQGKLKSKSPLSDKLPVYQCKFCKFSTDHRNVIETHLQHYHEEEYRFICPLCDLAFCKREETMVKHFKKWHPGRNVMFKRAPGFKNRENPPPGDKPMSYENAALKSLRPDLNDAQVSHHGQGKAVPEQGISATVVASQNKNISGMSPVFQLRNQQSASSSQSSSPGPDSVRKVNKPSITDIAANLASKVSGVQGDLTKASTTPVFLNIPNVRSRGSSPNAPDRTQSAVPTQLVQAAVGSRSGTGILDLSRSRESTPVPPAAEEDASNLKIVNVVSLSTGAQEAAEAPLETEEVKSVIYSCRNCKEESSSLDDIIKHIEAAHAQMDFWFACPYCPYGCSKHRGNMVRHIRRAHPANEANEVHIHLIDEGKYIKNNVVTTRQPKQTRTLNVPINVSLEQSAQMLAFSTPGSNQMIRATKLAQNYGAPPLIPMAQSSVNQQHTLPPPLIRAVAVTGNASQRATGSPAQPARSGAVNVTSGSPSSHMSLPKPTLPGQNMQTRFAPPNAQVFQGVPHQGVTHMSGGVMPMGPRFLMNPRMANIPQQAPRPKLKQDNISPAEQQKFSVFNLRPSNAPAVFPQASQVVTPMQPGVSMQYSYPEMMTQQMPFMNVPPQAGQAPPQGQLPNRPPQPPSS